MNAKLILAVLATLIASSSAYAAQPFGRDSVYATPGSSATSKPYTGPVATRHGRDSVYASQSAGAKERHPIQATTVVFKAGRA